MTGCNDIPLAGGVVGQEYTVIICGSSKEYTATVRYRSSTHTHLKHGGGETALPNNIGIELIALRKQTNDKDNT